MAARRTEVVHPFLPDVRSDVCVHPAEEVARGKVGAGVVDVLLDGSVRESVGLRCRAADGADGAAGVVVDAVTPGGPADRAGVLAGWVLWEVDGVRVDGPRSVAERIRAFQVGAGADLYKPLPVAFVVPLPANARGLMRAERACLLEARDAQKEALAAKERLLRRRLQ